jgi:hypothetical protein
VAAVAVRQVTCTAAVTEASRNRSARTTVTGRAPLAREPNSR